jgi:hypothetical protein
MKNEKLIIILVAIVVLAAIGTFLISKFSSPNAVSQPQLDTQTTTTITLCQKNQLSGNIEAQGAAGNIYATLTLTNIGKTACEIILGNTVTAKFDAKNILVHNEQTSPSQSFMLAPGAKVYSQIHSPNGPQCQSGITQKQITFFYTNAQTTRIFTSLAPQNKKLVVQACQSQSENTIVDIWPLSKNPITQ